MASMEPSSAEDGDSPAAAAAAFLWQLQWNRPQLRTETRTHADSQVCDSKGFNGAVLS